MSPSEHSERLMGPRRTGVAVRQPETALEQNHNSPQAPGGVKAVERH